MKRLQPAVWVALILAAHSVQAQTNAPSYQPNSASVYTDIVGEFEPSDSWTPPRTDAKPKHFSKVSSSKKRPAPIGPPIPENVEIFGKTNSFASTTSFATTDSFPTTNSFAATSSLPTSSSFQQATPGWRQTEAGQLWTDQRGRGSVPWWHDGPLRLQFGLDYLYFTRAAAADNLFAVNDLGENFSLADIDPGDDTALRYRFLVADDGGTGFEITGYDFQEFNGSLTLEGEGITPTFFGLIPADPVESYEASYESELTNIEANVWRRVGERLKIGFGGRYIKLEESFDVEFTGDPISMDNTGTVGMTPPEQAGFFSDTENRIFGGQFMARIFRPVYNKLYLEGGVDAGYGTNRITADSMTADIDSQTEEEVGTGFFGFNGGVTFRLVDGDQSAAIDSFTGTGEIQTGSLYFSGAYFGGQLRF